MYNFIFESVKRESKYSECTFARGSYVVVLQHFIMHERQLICVKYDF
jgi:hypothetical protein